MSGRQINKTRSVSKTSGYNDFSRKLNRPQGLSTNILSSIQYTPLSQYSSGATPTSTFSRQSISTFPRRAIPTVSLPRGNSWVSSSSSVFSKAPTAFGSLLLAPFRLFSRFTKEEEDAHREIEQWSYRFKREHVPLHSLEKNFSRSSGPGGQNVNKVSSKAELRFFLGDADWIHPKVREKLKKTASRYINTKGEFVITSDVHREQTKNMEECHTKIYQVIQEAAAVPKETSPEQKKKVEKLIAAQKKRDLEEKKRLKERKQDRRDKKW